MQVKKNPKVDLNRNSGLYFVIGLTIVLFLTWRALEYKSYPKQDRIVEMLNVVEDIKEDVPVTEQLKTPPPPPPPSAPEIIEIVEDAAEIEETIIESTESSQDQVIEVVEVDDVEVGEKYQGPLPLSKMFQFSQVVKVPKVMRKERPAFKRKYNNMW